MKPTKNKRKKHWDHGKRYYYKNKLNQDDGQEYYFGVFNQRMSMFKNGRKNGIQISLIL